ncbi:MAG: response regulator [Treponema sp.]|jgi:putative two-component system response regulator|nr:response regulator [Treponema sp.]
MTGGQKKIIAVDDNVENLNALRSILEDVYEVYTSPSAAKLFELLEHIKPDLILLDVQMPVMNGYDAAKKLKYGDKHNDTPIIFLTSMNDALSEMEGLVIGAVDYIHKPFVAPLLLQRIQMHLSMIEKQQEAQNAERVKNELLSRIKQEILSPLNAVIDAVNSAAQAEDLQSARPYFDKAGEYSKQMLDVVNDILKTP